MTTAARKEMGFLLRLVQDGEAACRSQGLCLTSAGCHELRVTDTGGEWRLVTRLRLRRLLS